MVDLELLFPKLLGSEYQITSLRAPNYNCIAWAAGDSSRWWWPDLAGERYRPAGAPREETVDAFQKAFQSIGFLPCGDEFMESGFEKIALFVVDDCPEHASRQLKTGRWTSKIGELEDIEHNLRDLEGAEYGTVALIMKRPIG